MKAGSQRSKGREGDISELNTAIDALNLAKDASGIAPAKAVFGSVTIILATIRVSFLPVLLTDCSLKCTQDKLISREDCVELGLACSDVCTALDRGLKGKRLNDLDSSVREAINRLTK